jgi:hypothetical protein
MFMRPHDSQIELVLQQHCSTQTAAMLAGRVDAMVPIEAVGSRLL